MAKMNFRNWRLAALSVVTVGSARPVMAQTIPSCSGQTNFDQIEKFNGGQPIIYNPNKALGLDCQQDTITFNTSAFLINDTNTSAIFSGKHLMLRQAALSYSDSTWGGTAGLLDYVQAAGSEGTVTNALFHDHPTLGAESESFASTAILYLVGANVWKITDLGNGFTMKTAFTTGYETERRSMGPTFDSNVILSRDKWTLGVQASYRSGNVGQSAETSARLHGSWIDESPDGTINKVIAELGRFDNRLGFKKGENLSGTIAFDHETPINPWLSDYATVAYLGNSSQGTRVTIEGGLQAKINSNMRVSVAAGPEIPADGRRVGIDTMFGMHLSF